MKTFCEGISFRSRTEAAWYLIFKRYRLNPIYEPETFEIEVMRGTGKMIWYMPDFQIDLFGVRTMVEIKASLEGEIQDIAKACILGYRIPTLIIVGWPLKYSATLIENRHKGTPEGHRIFFGNSRVIPADMIGLSSSYPDELDLEINQEDAAVFLPGREPVVGSVAYQIASECWNATQWKP